jgi:hypothetical protein
MYFVKLLILQMSASSSPLGTDVILSPQPLLFLCLPGIAYRPNIRQFHTFPMRKIKTFGEGGKNVVYPLDLRVK